MSGVCNFCLLLVLFGILKHIQKNKIEKENRERKESLDLCSRSKILLSMSMCHFFNPSPMFICCKSTKVISSLSLFLSANNKNKNIFTYCCNVISDDKVVS